MNIKKNSGVYVHIPYCIKKCNYCDFNSYSDKDIWNLRDSYFNALIKEIKLISEYTEDKCFDSIYFGGGTPTAVETEYIIRILCELKKHFGISKDSEITIECNPKTADYSKLKKLRECGINRISIGLQSIFDDTLKMLGRAHNFKDFEECYDISRKAGFENITVDLMFGLPEQTILKWKETIDYAVRLDINHISAYCLKIEEGTPFYDMELNLPSDDESREMYDLLVKRLDECGFKRYEISNFARNGCISRHNTKYWDGVEYVGLGSGASSYLYGVRYSNEFDVKEYIRLMEKRTKEDYEGLFFGAESEISGFNDIERLTEDDKMSEFIVLGLRKSYGVSRSEFYERFGIEIEEKFREPVSKYKKMGALCIDGDRMYIHPDMLYVSNSILVDFI